MIRENSSTHAATAHPRIELASRAFASDSTIFGRSATRARLTANRRARETKIRGQYSTDANNFPRKNLVVEIPGGVGIFQKRW